MLNVGMKMRQFVNVVTENYNGRLYSLHRIKASDLFYRSTEVALLKEAEQAKKTNADPCVKMIRSRLPRTRIKFIQSRTVNSEINFLPFYECDSTNESKIVCLDAAGQSVLYDTESATVETLPHLHDSKGSTSTPVALSVTHPNDDDHDPRWPHALYVMDNIHGSFQVLVYGDPSPDPIGDRMLVWHWKQLPPSPCAHGFISSYTLLDSSTICILSEKEDNVGTYCFNTDRQEWTKAGCWSLPFFSRGQVIPKLNNLCFGVADIWPHHFCALDLSSMDGSPPRLWHHWPDMDSPKGWSSTNASMAYMGAGKFCIAKTFDIVDKDTGQVVDTTAVLNGVEVVHKNGRTSKLRMIRHKSNRYSSDSHVL